MRKLLLFDIDGTLVRTDGLGRRALDQAFLEMFGWADATRGVSFLGATDPGIVRDCFLRQGRTEAEAAAALAAFFPRYEALLQALAADGGACEVLPGVGALLEHVQATRQARLALLTGNTRGGARVKLELAGLWQHFDGLGAFGDDAPRRVDLLPVALERARALGGPPLAAADCVVIGDTARDIEVAKAHGARSVAVCTGWVGRDELAQHAPDVLLDDLSQLEEVVEHLCG